MATALGSDVARSGALRADVIRSLRRPMSVQLCQHRCLIFKDSGADFFTSANALLTQTVIPHTFPAFDNRALNQLNEFASGVRLKPRVANNGFTGFALGDA